MESMERVYWVPFEDLRIVSAENKYGQAYDLAGRWHKIGG